MPGVYNFDVGLFGSEDDIYVGRGPDHNRVRYLVRGRPTFGQRGNEVPASVYISWEDAQRHRSRAYQEYEQDVSGTLE